ncbi:hypothetical protein [Prevotella disiens]|uniref:hypothetical protein n=1 Tax=Prevotella disiens TaxID=28130 RepID=UPI00242BC7C1|nr:hypothetical protein [Prevotella disiens]
MIATISADIIESTSLSREDYNLLLSAIKDELSRLEISIPGAWERIVRGDKLLFFVVNLKKVN